MNNASLSLDWHNFEWQLQAISGPHSPLRMQLLHSALTRPIVGEAELVDTPTELPPLLSRSLVPDAGEHATRERAATVPEIEPSPSAPSHLHEADLFDR
jgi:hypothetical protein